MTALLVIIAQLACPPSMAPGDDYPAAVLGCPAAMTGIIYPATHPDADAALVQAIRRQQARLDALDRLSRDAQASALAWALGGVALGAVATYALIR